MSEYNENTKGAWLINDIHFMQINDRWANLLTLVVKVI
jgi:hypothetical protein